MAKHHTCDSGRPDLAGREPSEVWIWRAPCTVLLRYRAGQAHIEAIPESGERSPPPAVLNDNRPRNISGQASPIWNHTPCRSAPCIAETGLPSLGLYPLIPFGLLGGMHSLPLFCGQGFLDKWASVYRHPARRRSYRPYFSFLSMQRERPRVRFPARVKLCMDIR